MKNATFDEFVKSQQVPEHPEIDWNNQRDEWLKHLDELYSRIQGFLKEYIDSNQIQIEFHPIQLNEEYIGPYKARQITLKIGRKTVQIQPVGTLLIGSKGRVDVIGPAGTVVGLMLINSKVKSPSDMIRFQMIIAGKTPVTPKEDPSKLKWEWKIVTRPPERRFIDITQETFFQMILEVANG